MGISRAESPPNRPHSSCSRFVRLSDTNEPRYWMRGCENGVCGGIAAGSDGCEKTFSGAPMFSQNDALADSCPGF